MDLSGLTLAYEAELVTESDIEVELVRMSGQQHDGRSDKSAVEASSATQTGPTSLECVRPSPYLPTEEDHESLYQAMQCNAHRLDLARDRCDMVINHIHP